MRFGSKQFLAIEWNRRDLRMVALAPKGTGVELVKAVSVPIPAEVRVEDAAALGAFIRAALRSADLGARRALLSIPRDQVVLNTLNLPPTPPEELAAIVQFQVVKELPFPAELATLDFAVCGEFDPKLPSNVLVAAVRNEDLDFYRQVAAAADLSVELIGLRPYSNLLAMGALWPDLSDKTILLVDVGPNLTEIDIIKGGVLAFSRAASVALANDEGPVGTALTDSRIAAVPLSDREPDERTQRAVSDLMVDIIRSFEAYRATDPAISVDQIVVCGSSGLEAQLAQALAARFAARAELYSPHLALGLPPQRARELRGFSATIGLALGHADRGPGHFDFLSPKKPVSKRALRMKKVPVAVATAVLFIASGIVFHYKYVAPQDALVAQLREEVNKKKKTERVINDFRVQVEALEAWVDSQQTWPEVLVALTEVFPPEKEAYVTRIDLDTRPVPKSKTHARASTVKLKFRTASLGTVNRLNDRLQEAGFQNVKPGKETPSPGPDGYSYETEIDADVPPRSELHAREAEKIEAPPAENKSEDAASVAPASTDSAKAPATTQPGAAPASGGTRP
ncbi:MAG TPA: pilus assembly protein PilM [Phycisphaerae bacterium]|nr:pilus assembly protein PilM [Phycisphaerae bacterium]